MRASYIHALEMRAKWLRYALENADKEHGEDPSYSHILRTYAHCLNAADSYYMNRNFCALVDHARLTVPDDVQFEESWMLSPAGFLWLETPFRVPRPSGLDDAPKHFKREMEISAIGWIKLEDGYYFMAFMDHANYIPGSTGFGCWSHVALHSGDTMIDRIRSFESVTEQDATSKRGLYDTGRETETLHEIRWIYSALHLMAQRLAHVSQEKTSGMARHSASRKRLAIAPILKVVSLRKMEAERPKGGPDDHQHRDWQWQWIVNGHWRLQPYKTLGDYKWIFIESYVKGPDSKPLKPPQHIIFKAER